MRRPDLLVLVGLIAAVIVAGSVTAPVLAQADVGTSVAHYGGQDRYETAAILAVDEHKPGQPVYIVTYGPDALAAGQRGPILYVTRDRVPQATADALCALRPPHVIGVGGGAVLDPSTVSKAADLAAGEGCR